MYVELTWTNIDPITGDMDWDSDTFQIKPLSLSAQTDLTGNSMPAGEYVVDVILSEPLPGELAACALYDDMDQLWCSWYPRKVQKISDTCIRITASSYLRELEYRELDAEMYTNKLASAAIADCFGAEHANRYTIGTSIASKSLTGFVPAQNARERLTWILFTLGAFAQDVFRDDILIDAVDDTETLIPYERTFMRPSMDTSDLVTGLKITTYTFRQAASKDEWQQDEGSYMFPLPWLATEQVFTLSNPAATEYDRPNVVEIDGLYLINTNNVSEIATRLAGYWFNNNEAQLDCINDREYKPGDLVTAYIDAETLVTGYIQQADFSFGNRARSTLKLIGAMLVNGEKLTVNYTYQGGIIGRATYYLPVGFDYSISNPMIDRTYKKSRYVYHPQAEAVTGTIVEGGNTATQEYDMVLKYENERLTVYAVDAIEKQENTGVIA